MTAALTDNIPTIVTVAAILAVGLPFFRSKRKDAAISELAAVNTADEKYIKVLERDKQELLDRATRSEEKSRIAEAEAAACSARYDELSKYAAPEAFAEVIEQLLRIRTAFETGHSATNELLMQNMSILAKIEAKTPNNGGTPLQDSR